MVNVQAYAVAVTLVAVLAAGVVPVEGDALFPVKTLVSSNTSSTYSFTPGDIDGDGLDDIVGLVDSPYSLGKVGWFRNVGALGWEEHYVGSVDEPFYDPAIGDVDGDGDADVVVVVYAGNAVYWFENTGAVPWVRRTIGTPTLGNVIGKMTAVADFDGDGDMDVLASGFNRVVLCRNDDTMGTTWTLIDVDTTSSSRRGVDVADVDGDGDLDVVDAMQYQNTVVWHMNDGGGASWTSVPVNDTASSVYSVAAGDMDGDSDIDIVAAVYSRDMVALYTNVNGSGLVWTGTDIAFVNNPRGVTLGDFDADGDLDVAVGAVSTYWLQNDGAASWTVYSVPASSNYRISVGDFDGNSVPDLACYNYVVKSTALSFAPTSVLLTPPLFPLTSYNVSLEVRTAANATTTLQQATVDTIASPTLSPPTTPLTLVVANGGVATFIIDIPDLILYTLDAFVSGIRIPTAPLSVDRRLKGAESSIVLPPAYATVVGGDFIVELHVRGLGGAVMAVPPGFVYASEVTTTLARAYTGSTTSITMARSGSDDVLTLSSTFDRLALYTLTTTIPGGGGTVLGSPHVVDRRVYAADSSIAVTLTNGSYSVPFNTQQQLVISLRGTGGVAHPVTPLFDYSLHLEVTIELGTSFVPTTLSHGAADGDVIVHFASAQGGSYTFSAKVDGVHIPLSPFTVAFVLQCPAGTRLGTTGCDDCPSGTYSDTPSTAATSSSCALCAPGMSSPVKSTSFLNCTCPSGFWFGSGLRTPTRICEICPPGGVCAGGLEYPVAAPGFFPVDDTFNYIACVRDGCVGGGGCKPEYTGFMCGTCAPGYYSRTETACERCPSGGTLRLVIAAVVLVLVTLAVSLFVAWTTVSVAGTRASEGAMSAQGRITAFRVRTTPVSVSMALIAYQVTGILARANFKWTDDSQAVLGVFSLFNIDSQAVAAECSLASFHTTYAISVLIPFVVVIAVMGVTLTLRLRDGIFPFLAGLADVKIRVVLDSVLFTLAPLLYIPMAQACLVLFDCSRLPNGSYVLDADTGVKCFDSAWWSVFPLGLIAIIGYVVGIPVYFGATIWARKHKLFDPSVVARFGSLYRNFRRDFFWGEIANLAKRLFIVVVATFFSRHQLVQIGLLAALLVCSGFFVVSRRPYFVPMYNGLEIRLTAVLLAVVFLGSASYAERASSSTDVFLLVATIIVVIALVAVTAHAVVTDILSIREERKTAFYSAGERQRNLVALISSELKDVEAGPALLHAAGEFLAILDDTVRESQSSRKRNASIAIPLDDVTDPVV